MHKRLFVENFGDFIGLKSNRLIVYNKGEIINEISLNRLKLLCINNKGVSLSSDLILNLSARGIKVFFSDFKNQYVAMLSGMHQHATTKVRQKQFEFISTDKKINISKQFIRGKIKNQLSVINYFCKYNLKSSEKIVIEKIKKNKESLKKIIKDINLLSKKYEEPEKILFGYEGTASRLYWKCLRNIDLLCDDFVKREKRGTDNLTNSCLNYGYAILMTPIWNSIVNAGLEPYCGLLHTKRPGKPSLVLDIMEEYRPWVVDRNIIKIRNLINKKKTFDFELKKRIIKEINNTLDNSYIYKKKRVRLENIIQRQIYRLSSCFIEDKKYRPYVFKW